MDGDAGEARGHDLPSCCRCLPVDLGQGPRPSCLEASTPGRWWLEWLDWLEKGSSQIVSVNQISLAYASPLRPALAGCQLSRSL